LNGLDIKGMLRQVFFKVRGEILEEDPNNKA